MLGKYAHTGEEPSVESAQEPPGELPAEIVAVDGPATGGVAADTNIGSATGAWGPDADGVPALPAAVSLQAAEAGSPSPLDPVKAPTVDGASDRLESFAGEEEGVPELVADAVQAGATAVEEQPYVDAVEEAAVADAGKSK